MRRTERIGSAIRLPRGAADARFDIACRRIEQAQRQRDLFVDAPVPEPPEDERMADLFADMAAD